MDEKNILVARVLTYTGIIPFLFLGIAVALQASGLDYSLALFAYGAVIISFLCGIHWAVFLFFFAKLFTQSVVSQQRDKPTGVVISTTGHVLFNFLTSNLMFFISAYS
jgi:hypothetical protein